MIDRAGHVQKDIPIVIMNAGSIGMVMGRTDNI